MPEEKENKGKKAGRDPGDLLPFIAVGLLALFALFLVIGDSNLTYAGADRDAHVGRWTYGELVIHTDTFDEVGPNRFFIIFFFLLAGWTALGSARLNRLRVGKVGLERRVFLVIAGLAFVYAGLDERFSITLNLVRALRLRPLFRSPNGADIIHIGHVYFLGGAACLAWYLLRVAPSRTARRIFLGAFAFHAFLALQPYFYQPGDGTGLGPFVFSGAYLYLSDTPLFDYEEMGELIAAILYCLAMLADALCETRALGRALRNAESKEP